MGPELGRSRGRWLRGLLLASALVATSGLAAKDPPTAVPNDPGQASAELAKLRERMAELQQQLEAARAQESGLARDVREVEQHIGKLNSSLRDLRKQSHEGERRLSELQDRYADTNVELEAERQWLGRQLRAVYMLGRQEQVKLLLNQEDPALMGRALTYYRYLNQARLTRIGKVETMLQELDQLQQDISNQRDGLAQAEAQQTTELAALDRERGQREALLGKLQTEIRAQGGQLAQLQKDEKRLEKLLKDLQRALADLTPSGGQQSFAKLKRKLPWPVTGQLAANFGDAREVGNLRWRGAFITAPSGREVQAVARGRVAFADYLRGFGLLVIIDHGDNYMTLYGHNQSLFKQVGEWVAAGEVIASVGDSGGMARTGVYFELRHKGEPVNPANWCAGKPSTAQARR